MKRAGAPGRSIRLASLIAALVAVPAFAQEPEAAVRRESVLLIYGEDSCPPSTENEVVVCARRPESERYRIPRSLRRSSRPEQSWASRVESLEDASRDSRPGSCSVVGTYGQSGCTAAMIRQWYAERRARPQRGY